VTHSEGGGVEVDGGSAFRGRRGRGRQRWRALWEAGSRSTAAARFEGGGVEVDSGGVLCGRRGRGRRRQHVSREAGSRSTAVVRSVGGEVEVDGDGTQTATHKPCLLWG
jgi:hypothetical protein